MTFTELSSTHTRLNIVEYAASVWNTASAGLEHDVERIGINGASRSAFTDLISSRTRRLELLRLDSLAARRKRIDLVIAYKALNGDLGQDKCN